MTVSAAAARSGPYDGPGSTFDYTFYISAASELLVTKTSTSDVDSTLELDTDYEVAISDDGTGTFTLVTALVEGEKVTAALNLDIEQATDLINLGLFSAETHEAALDYGIRVAKQQQEQLDRCLKVAISSDEDLEDLTYLAVSKWPPFVENPVLIDEATASNAATLDVGDESGDVLWSSYTWIECRLHNLLPATDDDYLEIQFGGSGSWWTTESYIFTNSVRGAAGVTTQTFITATAFRCCPNVSGGWRQGNVAAAEELHGTLRIGLASASGANTPRTISGRLTWGNIGSSPVESRLSGRFNTTSHVSAVRFFYGGGNIYGTASLWGWRKS